MLPLLLLALAAAPTARARTSSPRDLAAIQQVMSDFQTAIRTHDGKLLFSLMHDWHVLFAMPPSPEMLASARAVDPSYAGLRPGGLQRFVEFITTSKDKLDERILNPVIAQDDDVAVVTFDYQFLENDVVQNEGLETWQLTRRDGKWKIVSVLWSFHPPKARP